MRRVLAGLALAALAAPAQAQGSDELWEVTSQMNIPGMPAGMGGSTQRICRDKDPRREATSRQDMQGCKVTDFKESGNRITITMTCPQGTSVIDQTYNAARTEYKGTMRMTSRDGEMTMNMSGRKVGSCDSKLAAQERDKQVAAAQAQAKQGQAQAAAIMKQQEEARAQQCKTTLDNMDAQVIGYMEQNCKGIQADFCRRYQTLDGFLKAKGAEQGATMCRLQHATVKSSLCARAVREEHLAFLGNFCPVEGKPLAQQHCAGRSYTAAGNDKYSEFCRAYLANRDFQPDGPRPGAPAQSQTDKAKQAVTEGVQQGINKLKGLFGR